MMLLIPNLKLFLALAVTLLLIGALYSSTATALPISSLSTVGKEASTSQVGAVVFDPSAKDPLSPRALEKRTTACACAAIVIVILLVLAGIAFAYYKFFWKKSEG
jgi:hypothetical protein